ncbi:hypothetical protein BHE74_00056181 [Ensete ventricosum]|nr:hypothetical protein GW17_00006951 [Ensete ventricosum]RWW38576.1 hypothetical protein BHE74_00056181 [Ensete ventricosum]RZS18669.1 hypothetical protein BHM03_00050995 [Ensete ventricosum]
MTPKRTKRVLIEELRIRTHIKPLRRSQRKMALLYIRRRRLLWTRSTIRVSIAFASVPFLKAAGVKERKEGRREGGSEKPKMDRKAPKEGGLGERPQESD